MDYKLWIELFFIFLAEFSFYQAHFQDIKTTVQAEKDITETYSSTYSSIYVSDDITNNVNDSMNQNDTSNNLTMYSINSTESLTNFTAINTKYLNGSNATELGQPEQFKTGNSSQLNSTDHNNTTPRIYILRTKILSTEIENITGDGLSTSPIVIDTKAGKTPRLLTDTRQSTTTTNIGSTHTTGGLSTSTTTTDSTSRHNDENRYLSTLPIRTDIEISDLKTQRIYLNGTHSTEKVRPETISSSVFQTNETTTTGTTLASLNLLTRDLSRSGQSGNLSNSQSNDTNITEINTSSTDIYTKTAKQIKSTTATTKTTTESGHSGNNESEKDTKPTLPNTITTKLEKNNTVNSTNTVQTSETTSLYTTMQPEITTVTLPYQIFENLNSKESVEEHMHKLGDKEDDRYWPVAVALMIGIPAIIVIGVTITVLHKKRKLENARHAFNGNMSYPMEYDV